ncbi:EamA family transporter [Nocardia sp. NPDC004340]|uniref:EamA family transporter n=1 Tax=Nocardia sp. CA-136227 TaxID=3239979 RepID=UPI003D9959A4
MGTSVGVQRQRHVGLPGWSVPFVFIVSGVSLYAGAAIGVRLFDTVEPATVAWLRAAAAGVALLIWRRPWRARWTRRAVLVASGFGVVTLGMNIAFYEAIARIPLGTAVAIEFLGPIAVAALGSRRARDLLAVALVGAGVFLLAGVSSEAGPGGVGFAVLAGVLWAGYILLGKRVADTGSGMDALAIGTTVSAIVLAPILVTRQCALAPAVFADPRTWLLGVGVGVLSSAVPYALDQVVLRRVGRARFALLLALLPATAAVIGAVALAQRPGAAELAGIGLVMAALSISAGQRDPRVPAADTGV